MMSFREIVRLLKQAQDENRSVVVTHKTSGAVFRPGVPTLVSENDDVLRMGYVGNGLAGKLIHLSNIASVEVGDVLPPPGTPVEHVLSVPES